MKTMSSTLDGVLKPKTDDTKPPYHPSFKYLRLLRCHRPSLYHPSLPLLFLLMVSLLSISFFLFSPSSSFLNRKNRSSSSSSSISSSFPSYGGREWEKRVRSSARTRATHNSDPSRRALTVLVTGAAGFVGSHASLALKRRGDGVIGLDSFHPYYEPSLKRARHAHLQKHGIFIAEGDINDPDLLAKILDVAPISHVLHLAAQPGVRYSLKNPSPYVSSNVAGLVTLLEAIKNAQPQPAFVWASSSSVYGLNANHPNAHSFSESDRTDRPASLYAATKKAGEEITHAYNHIYGISVTALRFFTVYGPWGRPDMAYFSFTRDILRGKPIKIYDGSVRDFTYVDDVVRGCVGALDTAKKSTGSGGKKKGKAEMRTYNLGSTKPVKVAEMVDMLEGILGVKAQRRVVDMPRNGDVRFTHANVTLARRDLGYEPTTDLKAGLKKFVRWYLDYYPVKTKNNKLSS